MMVIGKLVKGKVYVFIDAANVFYSQKTLGWRISYKKLMEFLKEECDLGQVFLYTGVLFNNPDQERFLRMLEYCGYILRTKPVKKILNANGTIKKKANFDVEASFEMDDLSKEYDTAILISGDSDFAYTLKRLKKKSKNVIVISTGGHVSIELLREAKFIDFKKLKDKISL
ncbi:NYN domain-containing protein [bacterium]|nr:NYN domain-containing protein [bacterium]